MSRLQSFALALTVLSLLACSSGDDARVASERPANAGGDAPRDRVDSGTGVAADSGSREPARDAGTDAMVTPWLRDAGADAGQLVADADGGDDDSSTAEPVQAPWSPPKDRLPAGINFIYIEGDADDPVSEGRTHVYTQANALIEVTRFRESVDVRVQGDGRWTGRFAGPPQSEQLTRGFYPGAERAPFYYPGIEWTGGGVGCNTVTGWLAVDYVAYESDKVIALDLRFEQHCDGAAPALRGTIHFRADDPTRPPGPVNPPPPALWRPSSGVVPSGNENHVVLQIDDRAPSVLDTAMTAKLRLYTLDNGNIERVDLRDFADPASRGAWFETMSGVQRLLPGYYGDAQAFSGHNPARAGFAWEIGTSDCYDGRGWYVVDHVVYDAEIVTELDLRFERRCSSSVLHGQVHYVRPQ